MIKIDMKYSINEYYTHPQWIQKSNIQSLKDEMEWLSMVHWHGREDWLTCCSTNWKCPSLEFATAETGLHALHSFIVTNQWWWSITHQTKGIIRDWCLFDFDYSETDHCCSVSEHTKLQAPNHCWRHFVIAYYCVMNKHIIARLQQEICFANLQPGFTKKI